MDCLSLRQTSVRGPQLSHFEEIIETRAERHEHLRGRNNVTSCRSPPRELDAKLMKKELKEKRHLEFLRRRPVSPERCGSKVTSEKVTNCSSRKKTFSVRENSSSTKSETLHTNIHNTSITNGHSVMRLTPKSNINDEPNTSKWVKKIHHHPSIPALHKIIQQFSHRSFIFSLPSSLQASLWSDQKTLRREERSQALASSTYTATIKESNQHRMKSTDELERSINGTKKINQ